MGGTGSGRYSSTSTTADLHSIDLAEFGGVAWCQGIISWSRGEARVGSAQFELFFRTLRLRYTSGCGSNEEMFDVSLRLEATPTQFGGERLWIKCPGQTCGGRRCRVIYLGPSGPFCRKCYGLKYPSQREPAHVRKLAMAQRIKMKLGSDQSPLAPFPDKPKGLHWKTYDKLEARYVKLCHLAAGGFVGPN